MSIARRLAATAALSAVLLTGTAGAAMAGPRSHDANIKYSTKSSGHPRLLVCSWYSDFPVKRCGGTWRSIKEGQTTKGTLGWKDADAFLKPEGCSAVVSTGANAGGRYGPGPAKTIKVRGFFGAKVTVKVTC